MLIDIDKFGGWTIRKHLNDKTKELLGYQAVKLDPSTGAVAECINRLALQSLRLEIGYPAAIVSNPTQPKAAHKHNQKGYRADSMGRKS